MLKRVFLGTVLLALAFVGLRVGAPYAQSYQFTRVIRDEVESQSVRPHPAAVHARVLQLGREMGFNLAAEDVEVESLPGGRLEVRVRYNVVADLMWFQYPMSFSLSVRPRLGEQ